MAAAPELNERLLIDAGGWQAMKVARGLHSAERVTEARWEPPELLGRVREGETEFRAGLKIVSHSDVTNLCTCRPSRQHGIVCAHSLAVGLECLRPHRAPRAAQSAQPETSNPSPNGLIGGLSISSDTGVPVELAIVFPANLASALTRESVTVVPEILAPERKPLAALSRGQTYRVSPEDLRLLSHLVSEGGGLLPSVLTLRTERFVALLPLLAGHPRVTLGRGAAVPIAQDQQRLTLRGEARETGDLRLSLVIPTGARLLIGTDSAWLFSEPARLAPVGTSFPIAYKPLLEGGITIPAAGVASFLSRESSVLERFFDLQLPRSHAPQIPADPTPAPTFKLKIEGSLNHLEAELEARTGTSSVTITSAGYRPSHRSEALAAERLRASGFEPSARGPWVLKGEPAILQFFARDLPQLEKDWTVSIGARFAHVSSDLARIEPVLQVRGSGESWFEVGIEFSVGGTDRIAASEIRRLLASGHRTVKLRNQKRAVLHDGLLAEFDEVLRDCNPAQRQPGLYRFDSRDAGYVNSLQESVGARIETRTPGALDLGNFATIKRETLGRWETILRDYQKDGVHWLRNLATRGVGGILADEMGLGKTVQALCFLSELPGCSLVVCPSSLVVNWEREAARFAPELAARAIHGNDRWKDQSAISGARLLITSYALLRRDSEIYQRREFACVVLDEAQHIRNPQSQAAQAAGALRAQHRFALTGTPIENSIRDIWSIFHFLMPGYLGSQQEFRERYEVPVAAAVGGAAHRRLARRLNAFLLRRTKREVAKELPDKIEQTVACELDEKEKAMYFEILRHARESLAAPDKQGRRRMTALTMLLRLRQACLDRRLLGLAAGQPRATSAKLELLSELLDEAVRDGHRVLVFSQFATMLRLIRERLDADAIACCYLDGSTRDRQGEVDRFQSGTAPVFLISLKAGGVGLNLTAADTVIHFDPWWNPAVEAQATDRAHRIGQTRVVTAYKLIARGTVEEKIVALQERKRAMADLTVDGEEPLMGGLTDADLAEILGP